MLYITSWKQCKRKDSMEYIVISAYACEPHAGSEPGVGWHWAEELSRYYKVIVITRENNRGCIESELAQRPNPRMKFYYCDISSKYLFWKKGQKGVHLYYYLWQKQCYKVAADLIEKYKPKFVFGLTFGNMWLPTYLDKLPCDFIWGPLGGGEGVPRALLSAMDCKQKLFEIIRGINRFFPVTNLRFNQICKNSKLIITRTIDSLKCIPEKYHHKCVTILETGISQNDIDHFCDLVNQTKSCFKPDFVISGRIVPFKLFPLAIESFALLVHKYPTALLHVIGDGPENSKCKEIVRNYKIEKNVVFHGQTGREDALSIMSRAAAVVITSAREGGSWILFEAMLLKKPIICFNTSGMRATVDQSSGYLVNVCTYEEAKYKFAKYMEEVIENPEEAIAKGIAGYKKVVSEFTWKAKIDTLQKKIMEELN